MTKKKILHIAQSNGGVERYLKMFFKYFNNNDYCHILIASQDYQNVVCEFQKLGVDIYIVPMEREINLIEDFKSLYRVTKLLKKIKPHLVYAHSSKAGVYGRIVSRLLGYKIIYNPHGWAFDMQVSQRKKSLFINIERILASITDKVIAISNHEKNIALINKIGNDDKIIVIENGIDLEIINKVWNSEDILKSIGWSKDDFIVGMIARISEQKSPKTFVNIAEKLILKLKNAKFILIGDGDQRKEIEQIIKKKGLSNKFYITGWIENPIEYAQILDVALLTSRWEGFGLVIPEYMLLNKPVVASNVGGIANIINNGENGFLIDDLNEELFVEKILYIYNNNKEVENITRLAKDQVFERFDFRRVVDEHITIFNQLL